jgi:hypothetical protein
VADVTSLDLLGARTPRRTGIVAPLLVLALVALFFLGAIAQTVLSPRPRASDGLPMRISVHGREYDHGGRLTDAQVAEQRGEWTLAGHVGPTRLPVYDVDRVPGLTVVGVVVEPAPGTYVSYSLVGGP